MSPCIYSGCAGYYIRGDNFVGREGWPPEGFHAIFKRMSVEECSTNVFINYFVPVNFHQ